MIHCFIRHAEAASSSSDDSLEALREVFRNPVLYIVLGSIVLLIVALYLWKRNIHSKPGYSIIVIRGGKIHKVVDEKSSRYYLVPFVDKVGATIPLGEQTFESDKLYINDGPDSLYQINYCLEYRVSDPSAHFAHKDSLKEKMAASINDTLREFADRGNASMLVKDYRSNEKEILALFEKAISGFSLEALSFKINFIFPLGKK